MFLLQKRKQMIIGGEFEIFAGMCYNGLPKMEVKLFR